MKVINSSLPIHSLIEKKVYKSNYWDSFSVQLQTDQMLDLETCVRLILNFRPAWYVFLIKLRNIGVKAFGLKSGNGTEYFTNIDMTIGGKVAFFDVNDRTDTEILLSANDKHLMAYLSIVYEKKESYFLLQISTIVFFHNCLGRVYFFIIKPFHKIIIKKMLLSIVK